VDPSRPAVGPSGPEAPTGWPGVYQRQRDPLVRLAYLLTGSQAVAEDLVQDTFIRVMARIDPDANPGPYLRRSVVNACTSWHRRRGREVAGTPRGPEAPDPDDCDRDRSPYTASSIEMWDALGGLGARRRSVLVLRYYLDMTEAEVAATLGWRVGTVKSTTHRALADLKRILKQ
jgi:RNA polymerase sigma-70 factor (sigma-E family)